MIKIGDKILKKEWDLYEMYNEFLQDMIDGYTDNTDIELIEDIRDWYKEIWKLASGKKYKNTDKFEKKCVKMLGRVK